MSTESQRVEFIDEKDGKAAKPEKKKGSSLGELLSGNILSRESVTSQVPYFFFLALLAIIYIANRYRYEKLVRQSQEIQIEVKNLRAESITTAAELMNISKQTQVARMVEEKGLGLKESVVPPKKIKARL